MDHLYSYSEILCKIFSILQSNIWIVVRMKHVDCSTILFDELVVERWSGEAFHERRKVFAIERTSDSCDEEDGFDGLRHVFEQTQDEHAPQAMADEDGFLIDAVLVLLHVLQPLM